MDDFEQDNIIQWIFEKMFNQLTLDGAELYATPFEKIKTKTFNNEDLYYIINKLCNKPVNIIKQYLKNPKFQEKFLFMKMKKKIHVQILLDNIDKIRYLINFGYKPDNKALQLAVLNNRPNILEEFTSAKLTNDLLMYCAEFGHEQMYFYLRGKNLLPNISIYNKAVLGNSLDIVKDINKIIGLSKKILTSAFITNNTDIILFLVQEARKEKKKLDDNLITYPILNANFILLEQLEKLGLVDWHDELYYSALLSGSMEMVKYMEQKLPQIHDKHILDISKTKKGQSSILLEDMVYEYNGKKYFSHCINYAIQSGSLEIVKYIYSKKYGITISNILTAIKQGTVDILKFLLQSYQKPLSFFLLHYFGMNSFIPNKMEKAKILIENDFSLDPNNSITLSDYKKESVHLEMISESVEIAEEGQFDIDYLMKYQIFFVPLKGYKLNHRLLTKMRICLELNLEIELANLFTSELNDVDKQFIIDSLFLFGTIIQIKKFYPMLGIPCPPSKQILMEIICYCQINKLCYLVYHNLLPNELIKELCPLFVILADPNLNLVFNKIGQNIEKPFKFILLSGKKKLINEWVNSHPHELTKTEMKDLLMLDDIDLIKKINIDHVLLDELIDWSTENDLLEVAKYLESILHSK